MIMYNAINWELITGEGLIITLTGYMIVFMALVLLFFVFNWIPKLMHMYTRRKLRRQGVHREIPVDAMNISGEVSAAVGTALFMYFNELHDTEDPVITIKRISKNYSPWSSKIYSVTRGLNRRF